MKQYQRHKERLTLPAKERYEEFRKQFPEICQRVNLGYIASYLGITLSTLSRLRSSGLIQSNLSNAETYEQNGER